MLNNDFKIRQSVASDYYTPMKFIADTMCYIDDDNIALDSQFLSLMGVDGEKTFFKTLFYAFKLRNDIGENEFSDVITQYLKGKSIIKIFRSYACTDIKKDNTYLNELFSIIDISDKDISSLTDEDLIIEYIDLDNNQKAYTK